MNAAWGCVGVSAAVYALMSVFKGMGVHRHPRSAVAGVDERAREEAGPVDVEARDHR